MNKLIIDSAALRKNIENIKQSTQKKVCLVVKADAYGHGIENVVPFVDDLADFYAVAKVSEGVQLRNFTNKKILVLGPFEECDLIYAKVADLRLTIHNFNSLNLLIESKEKFSVHIKINTGMNRLGFDLSQLSKAKRSLLKSSNIIVEGIYSHIYNASCDLAVKEQIELFDKAIKLFGRDDITSHICATESCLKTSKYDMVRLGLGLYGYPQGFKALKIYSNVAQIIKIDKGKSVGYGGEFVAEEDMYIATIPLGYYDGVPVNLSQKGCVIIRGKKCRVVGRVCMDMLMCQVDKTVKPGDIVNVFWDAKLWATIKHTHEWDILTSIKRNRFVVRIK